MIIIKTTETITVTEVTRQQLYDEVWKEPLTTLSKKYGIIYSQFIKQIKEVNIPTPPSGYWTKLEFGKADPKPMLTGSSTEIIKLLRKETKITDEPKEVPIKTEKGQKPKLPQIIKSAEKAEPSSVNHMPETCASLFEAAETVTIYNQNYNIYDRRTLYNEVWSAPVTRVAQKYNVSDVAIHKICKALDIPTPPQGYWAKVKAGKEVAVIPLPNPDTTYTKQGLRGPEKANANESGNDVSTGVEYLTEKERKIVLAVAEKAELSPKGSRKHTAVKAQKEYFENWQRTVRYNSASCRMYWERKPLGEKPIWADETSPDVRDRIYLIMDSLAKTIEKLGGKLNNDFSFTILDEKVLVRFSEYKDKMEHIPTETEKAQLRKYEEDLKKQSYFSRKPQIRKYDYKYNSRLRMDVGMKTFRDNQKFTLEDYLGNIIVALFNEAGLVRKKRSEREEAERKRQRIEARKEKILKQYNEEIDRTNTLISAAEDYDISCKIRNYIQAYANLSETKVSEEWLQWANKKADWFDPTVALEDDILGARKHGDRTESKKLEHRYNTYWIELDED